LYIRKDHRVRRLRDGLSTLMFLALASLFTGFFGAVWELFSRMSAVAAGKQQPSVLFAVWLFESTATMIAAHIVTLAISLFWFLILGKALRIERAEAALLME
jgi:hypothetical protein